MFMAGIMLLKFPTQNQEISTRQQCEIGFYIMLYTECYIHILTQNLSTTHILAD